MLTSFAVAQLCVRGQALTRESDSSAKASSRHCDSLDESDDSARGSTSALSSRVLDCPRALIRFNRDATIQIECRNSIGPVLEPGLSREGAVTQGTDVMALVRVGQPAYLLSKTTSDHDC